MAFCLTSAQLKGKQVLRPIRNLGDNPLWNHVQVLNIPIGGGGNRVWSCNYCNKKVTGSYSKVKAHLLKIPNFGVEACKSVTDDILAILKREHDETKERKTQEALNARNKAEYVTLPVQSDLMQSKKRRGSAIEKAFNLATRDEVDKLAARMFYASAIPFNLARCPYFRKYSQKLAESNLSGYTPPTYDRLRTTLLAQEKAHVDRLLQPIKESWRKKGVSICSDGWSDVQRRPLINIMAASSGGIIFLTAIDASGEIKSQDYIAGLFIDAIKQVGEINVVQIVTDNASNYKGAGMIIEGQFPHVFWTPCVVHCLNLALKSICQPSSKLDYLTEFEWISKIVSDVQTIRNFIFNHSMPLAIFNTYSKLNLLKVAETRFASVIVMTERLRKVKITLEQMVMDARWKTFRSYGNNLDKKANDVKLLIVDDNWWDKIDYFLKFTKPIVDMLRAADKDGPLLHLIYDMWDTMIENVKAIIFEQEGLDISSGQSQFFDAIHEILVSRWAKSNTPLHCLAHALVPKYYSASWLECGAFKRLAPHEDEEISINRLKCFQRLFPNQEDLKKVSCEYGAFSTGSEFFNQPHVVEARSYEEPLSWWANYGSPTPLLQALAFKLLAQPASSSCCERNWSTYSQIHSIKRNKLTTSRAEDLVFVHSNLRLLSRKEEDYTKGPSKYWDIGGDRHDFDGAEFNDLSIDDPEVESYMFGDEKDEEYGMVTELVPNA